jgi:hypothetical protein
VAKLNENEVPMKLLKSFLTLALLSSTVSFAAVVNLKLGESTTISANTPTTVTCGSVSDTNCSFELDNLKTQFQYCKNVGTNSIQDCLVKIWPKFKQANPSCIEDAYGPCLSFCAEDPIGIDCLKLCE